MTNQHFEKVLLLCIKTLVAVIVSLLTSQHFGEKTKWQLNSFTIFYSFLYLALKSLGFRLYITTNQHVGETCLYPRYNTPKSPSNTANQLSRKQVHITDKIVTDSLFTRLSSKSTSFSLPVPLYVRTYTAASIRKTAFLSSNMLESKLNPFIPDSLLYTILKRARTHARTFTVNCKLNPLSVLNPFNLQFNSIQRVFLAMMHM